MHSADGLRAACGGASTFTWTFALHAPSGTHGSYPERTTSSAILPTALTTNYPDFGHLHRMTEFKGIPLPCAIPDNLTLVQFILDEAHVVRPVRPVGAPWFIEDATGRKVDYEQVCLSAVQHRRNQG